MSRLVATEWEIETTGRRVRRGEWYRVTAISDWDQGVISRRRYRTLRAARAAQADWERTGVTALLEIYAEEQTGTVRS